MAVYPGARFRNIPPGSGDPAIIPIGVILHVDAGNSGSLYTYFNGPSGGIESHFFIRKDGGVEQYRDTAREADANYKANSFLKDGKRYGFISVETQGLERGEWTAAQLREIKELLLWAHKTHGIPLRRCPAWNAAGIGYHVMFGAPSQWTPVSKSCPGPDRVRQFNNVLVPWFANATVPTDPKPPVQEDDEMTPAQMQELKNYVTSELTRFFVFLEKPNGNLDQQLAATEAVVQELVESGDTDVKNYMAAVSGSIKDYLRQTDNESEILAAVSTLAQQVADLTAKVEALPKA